MRTRPLKADRCLEAADDSRAAAQASEICLAVEHIDFSYGPLQILFDVSLELPKGHAVALLGTNGAGKSTLLKVVSGLLRPDTGKVWFNDDDITNMTAEHRVTRGMTLVEGGKAIFSSLSVIENLRLGADPFMEQRDLVEQRLEEALELFPALRDRLRQTAGTLSGGEQQMVAVGRAIVAGAELLIIDELSLGLAPIVIEQLVHATHAILASGRTLLLVEQSLNVAMALADHAYFMEKGEVRFSGRTEELLERGDLARAVFLNERGA